MDKKPVMISKAELTKIVNENLEPKEITIKNLKVLLDERGLSSKYTWKKNKQGHLTAWLIP